ncbi:S8 family serine peptidase [Pontibacter sp. SGAir0037]|uniref:S8 family serine peptidase n=1 Tax=Pontibacter sp. SGAir0037 TaxID=2571030 RepID=UPI00143CEC4B|nr:S8 family serine peptidase [Pontibacter sp. SGAir0037]
MRYSKFLICLLALVCLFQDLAFAAEEQKHLIYFKDKVDSPFSVQNPHRFLSAKAIERRQKQNISITPQDLPVNPAYVAALRELGISVWYTSRWFNAAVVQCSSEKLAEAQNLPFVKASQNLNRITASSNGAQSVAKPVAAEDAFAFSSALQSSDYGQARQQAAMLGLLDLHAAGYNGSGMSIAVFDTGFPAVNTLPAFSHLFQNNQIRATYDFVANTANVYGSNAHGTMVLSTMAAYAPGQMIGTAYGADYYLFRTEDVSSEHNLEEINWLLAAEFADSAGVDIINSSLGYKVFDAPSQSYNYNQMDGNTAIITRAADYAAAKGILVVVSAGNDGASSSVWQRIGAPADADSVLTVGAVNAAGNLAAFSSYGPTADGRIKPDVVALGQLAYVFTPAGQVVQSNGTSFSSPIMAGMAACLWQAFSNRSNIEMLNYIRSIGSQAASPDNRLGYGIPDYRNSAAGIPRLPVRDEVIITNPVKDNALTLTLGGDYSKGTAVVHIFDTAGRLLYKQELQAHHFQHTLSIGASIPKQGIYLCRVSTGSKATTVRFLKL